MKQQFILIGLKDCQIVTSTWLTSSGVESESEYFVVGKNLGIYDTHMEAIQEMDKQKNTKGYDGFKIDMIYQPE